MKTQTAAVTQAHAEAKALSAHTTGAYYVVYHAGAGTMCYPASVWRRNCLFVQLLAVYVDGLQIASNEA